MTRVVLFIIAFILWILLTWPVDVQDTVLGVVCALLVAFVMRELTTEKHERLINPARYFWMIVYFVVFVFYVIKANVDVAYRVLHPAMPIHPGIVKVKSTLRSATARTMLGNSITLTPGTMTVDILDDGTIYVHWINVKAQDVEEATKEIIGRFEWLLKRVFE